MNDVINEMYRPARRRFIRRPTVIKGLDDLICIDLMDMSKIADKNDKTRFLVCAVNAFSKFGYVRPVPSKRGDVVTKATESILNEATLDFKHCQTDQGTEFFNKDFRALMEKRNIKHYNTFSEIKSGIAERLLNYFHCCRRRL